MRWLAANHWQIRLPRKVLTVWPLRDGFRVSVDQCPSWVVDTAADFLKMLKGESYSHHFREARPRRSGWKRRARRS